MIPEPPASGRSLGVWLSLALVLCLAAVYAQTARHGFLAYDDGLYVTENARVTGGLSPANVRSAWLDFHGANWHPLTMLSHQLDVSLFGLESGAHHLVNAALHTLSALLCLCFFWRTTGAPWASALVAFLFALHPLRVESVAWVAERKDVLAGAFFFLTLLAHAAWVRSPTPARRARIALCLLFGLLAKPMLVTVPLVLLLLERWPLRRTAPLRARVREKIELFLLAAGSAAMTIVAQRAGGTLQALEQLSLGQRAATAVQGPLAYLRQSLWPSGLAPFYPHPALVPGQAFELLGGRTLAGLLGLVGLSLLAWRFRQRRPAVAVGWLWFLIMLLPVAGLVQVGLHLHADRYTYLPGIGLAVALVFGLRDGLGARAARVAWTAGLASALVLAGLSRRQTGLWHDTGTLFGHALAVTDGNYVAHHQLGLMEQQRGDFERAKQHYREALAIHPQLTGALGNLGAIHVNLGELEAGRACFQQLHELLPENLQGRLGLAALALQENRPEEAVRLLSEEPPGAAGFPLAMFSLAEAHELLGDWPAALRSYERAFAAGAIDPGAAAAAAWILATGPDPSLLDGARAVELALLAAAGGVPNALEVQAAACARAGDFARAVSLQERLVRESGEPVQRFLHEERLRLYRAGKPYTRR